MADFETSCFLFTLKIEEDVQVDNTSLKLTAKAPENSNGFF